MACPPSFPNFLVGNTLKGKITPLWAKWSKNVNHFLCYLERMYVSHHYTSCLRVGSWEKREQRSRKISKHVRRTIKIEERATWEFTEEKKSKLIYLVLMPDKFLASLRISWWEFFSNGLSLSSSPVSIEFRLLLTLCVFWQLI